MYVWCHWGGDKSFVCIFVPALTFQSTVTVVAKLEMASTAILDWGAIWNPFFCSNTAYNTATRVIYLHTSDWQIVNCYSTNHELELIFMFILTYNKQNKIILNLQFLNNFSTIALMKFRQTFDVTANVYTSCLLLGPPESNWCFSFAPELVGYSAPRDLHRRAAYSICESLFLIHQDVYHDLFVCSWWFID